MGSLGAPCSLSCLQLLKVDGVKLCSEQFGLVRREASLDLQPNCSLGAQTSCSSLPALMSCSECLQLPGGLLELTDTHTHGLLEDGDLLREILTSLVLRSFAA